MTEVVDATGIIYIDGTNGTNSKRGWKIHTKTACKLIKVNIYIKDINECYLYLENGTTLLQSSEIIGDNAIFDYDLADDTTYLILCGNNISQYVGSKTSGAPSIPISGTNINFIIPMLDNTTEYSALAFNIVSVTTTELGGGLSNNNSINTKYYY